MTVSILGFSPGHPSIDFLAAMLTFAISPVLALLSAVALSTESPQDRLIAGRSMRTVRIIYAIDIVLFLAPLIAVVVNDLLS